MVHYLDNLTIFSMNFNKEILIFTLLFLISGCTSGKNQNNVSIENEKEHRPTMNPGGNNFGDDPEFCKSYNKLQIKKDKECRKPKPSCKLESCATRSSNDMIDDLPQGATLIAIQKSKKSCKPCGDDDWFNTNCVANTELPERLDEVIEARCQKIIEEKQLPEVVLNNGKTIMSADCVDLSDIEIIDYEDGPNLKYKKKQTFKKTSAHKPTKTNECADYATIKKKKFFKISY